MPDPTLDPIDDRSTVEVHETSDVSTREPVVRDLSNWLADRSGLLAERWIRDILRREQSPPEVRVRIVGRFARLIARVLPMMLGPHRNELRSTWDRTAELYGAVAAKRGLAAGEVIEEFHALRELVIRELYADAPLDGSTAWPMREVLRLNRALDRAVTHASIGHTDTLFFEFFGPDAGRSILGSDDVPAEAERQLEELTAEIREHFGAFASVDAASEH